MPIIDNFIGSFEDLRVASIERDFTDEVNPVDGVVYPLICKDIPEHVEYEVIGKLSILMGAKINDPLMFIRKSPLGVKCPHQAHNDSSMGFYSLMLYISEGEGGTSLLRHKKTGIAYAPEDQYFVDIIQKDQNEFEKWDVTDMAKMHPNRAFIFDSNRLHRAEPVGGFGEGNTARSVLTCFYS